MKQFFSLFKKVNGIKVLKQYAKAHVLFHSICSVMVEGFSKKSLEIVRLSAENKILKKLRKKYSKFIRNFKQNNAIAHGDNPSTIWVCWFQGLDDAPDIVKTCVQSLRNIPGYEVVVITWDNYKDYVTFPDYIVEKYERGIIGQAHFSDLLRLELLIKYGGTWIDSTVLCTDTNVPDMLMNSDLFVYRILKPGVDGHGSSISNWFITACQENIILKLTLALLYEYWRKYNIAIDYYIFHLFFELAMEAYPEQASKIPPFSSETPHILQLRMFDTFDIITYEFIKGQTCFHKLTYKNNQEDIDKSGTYYKHIVSLERDCNA